MKNIIKKISAFSIIVSCMFVAQIVSESKSEAQINTNSAEEMQVIYSRQCCDSAGYVRCIIINWTPVGNGCFCPGQGSGWVC